MYQCYLLTYFLWETLGVCCLTWYVKKNVNMILGKMCLCNDEIFWEKMPLVVMKFVGAKYGNKNVKIILVKKCPYVVMKYFGAKYGNNNVKNILVKKCPYVVMKYFGAKYGNKNVKIILVKKCPYVVMKYFGGKSCQATYPHGFSLLLYILSRGLWKMTLNFFWLSNYGSVVNSCNLYIVTREKQMKLKCLFPSFGHFHRTSFVRQ